MTNQNLIVKVFEGSNVFFMEDGYINATKAAKLFAKDLQDWLRLEPTFDYAVELAKSLNLFKFGMEPYLEFIKDCNNKNVKRTKILQLLQELTLIKIKMGSPSTGGGTWIHPKLGVVFNRWLSTKFAIWCDEQSEQIIRQQSQTREEHIREQLWKLQHDPIVEVSFQMQMSYIDRLTQRNFTWETFQPFFGLNSDRFFSMRLGGIINVAVLGISAKQYRELVLGPEGYATVEGKRRRGYSIITDNLDGRFTRDILPKPHQECIQRIITDVYRYFRVRPNWTQSQVSTKTEEVCETHKLNTDLLVSRNLHNVLSESVDSFAEFTAQHHVSPYNIIQQNLVKLNYDHVALEREIRTQQAQALSAMM